MDNDSAYALAMQDLSRLYPGATVSLMCFVDAGQAFNDGKTRFMPKVKSPPFVKKFQNVHVFGLSKTCHDVMSVLCDSLERNKVYISPKHISQTIGKSSKAVYHAIDDLCKAFLLERKKRGLYFVNPRFYWKGPLVEIVLHQKWAFTVDVYYTAVEKFDLYIKYTKENQNDAKDTEKDSGQTRTASHHSF